MPKGGYTYILTNQPRGTLYIGVSSDLVKRIWEHREKLVDGFSKKYNLTQLVHFEQFDDIYSAIEREKRLKRWSRSWKLELIEDANPGWQDLYDKIL